MKEHLSDSYVKKAQQTGYRSRAVFKLLEIDKRDHLFKPGMSVIDLGAAPGSWSQLVVPRVKPGRVMAVDLLPIVPIDGVEFIQGDFTDPLIYERLTSSTVDWVLSDMAPNLSGNASVDIPRALYLGEMALELAKNVLIAPGGLLIKVFQGEGFDAFYGEIKNNFRRVVIRKPKASRGRSREVYILAREIRHLSRGL